MSATPYRMHAQVQELRSKLVQAESAAVGGNARSEAEAAEIAQLRRQLEESVRSEERLRRQLLEVHRRALCYCRVS